MYAREFIPEEQYGFVSGRSTIQAASLLHKEVSQTLEKERAELYAVFVDFAKAFDSSNGVMQGDPCSPFLFNIFTHDLPDTIIGKDKRLKVIMYADDLAIVSEELGAIQEASQRLETWCGINMLEVNVNKTKVMRFKKGGPPPKEYITYKGEKLEYTNSFKYLGITFQQ
ncbi:hypothetical protein B566_EDAN011768, partial [Ephemera danica]